MLPMIMRLSPHQRLFSLVLLSSLIWGCVSEPPIDTSAFDTPETPRVNTSTDGSVQSLLNAAQRARTPERQRLFLQALDALAQQQDWSTVAALLLQYPKNEQTPQLNAQALRLQADAALALGQADAALDYLSQAEILAPGQGAERQADLQRRLQAYQQQENAIEVAQTSIALLTLSSDPVQQQQLRQQIWQTLIQFTPAALQLFQTAPAPDARSGWLELARLYLNWQQDINELNNALDKWQQRYPNHPALSALPQPLERARLAKPYAPQHVGVLLPLSGPLLQAGQAIRDGILTQHYDKALASQISFYDTHAQELPVLLEQLSRDQVDFIIGPLQKGKVQQLQQTPLDLPVLMLNQLTASPLSADHYQFALRPEQEAYHIAERAWQADHRLALMLTPDNDWGQRLVAAFGKRWAELGGELVDSQTYQGQTDLAKRIQTSLAVDKSEHRAKTLQWLLGQRLEFEPRRRQDIDFIFVAAQPTLARQIRPLLDFYYATELPIFATSHIFSGEFDPKADSDLNQVTFCDIPWKLDPELAPRLTSQTYWPKRAKRLPNLFALGSDAYRLMGELKRLKVYPEQEYLGSTGRLFLSPDGTLERRLQWAQFRQGTPRTLEWHQPISDEVLVLDQDDALQSPPRPAL